MPIYEYYSPDTNRIYSFYARSLAQGRLVPRCPDREGARMERMISRFAVTGRAVEERIGSEGAGDLRVENMLGEMEREMAGMDDKNPDPKLLGRMMRRMAEATGRGIPAEMEEMIRRMESGEDPEKLEEEFGGAFDAMEMADDVPEPDERVSAPVRKCCPVRDPKLYEISEFI